MLRLRSHRREHRHGRRGDAGWEGFIRCVRGWTRGYGTQEDNPREELRDGTWGHVAVVKSLSHVLFFVTPWTVARQASLSFTTSRSLLKLMSIESMMPSSHLILCRPLLLLPSIFHSIRVFSNESALRRRWPKYYRFSFSISPSNKYSGLISFRMDWLDLLAVQGTLKSLLQYHTTVQKDQFFSAQHFIF